MKVLKSLGEVEAQVWKKYGDRISRDNGTVKIMSCILHETEVREIVEFTDLIRIETDRAVVKIGKGFWKLEVEYK